MTPDENGIMADLYHFLRDHNDPPTADADGCAAFWEAAARDLHRLAEMKWHRHPLAMGLGIALYEYLEKKCKAKGGGGP